ncbi:MAG: hypothetical protein PHN56_03225 [Candidatus Nanoarchaeia archaeon]|nr:hypothetical protein [Candidatus Nanoarchaeia archaeon]
MQKYVISILFILAIMPIACAGIDIKTSVINNQVKPGEIVAYNLLINNTDMWNKTATIFILSDKLYAIEPTYYLVLPAYSQTVAKIKIIVPNNLVAQRYYEDVFIKFSDFTEVTQRISYDVKGPELYLKLNSIEIDQDINPLEDFNLTLTIENNYFEKAKTALLQINVYDDSDSSVYYTSKQIDLLEGVNPYKVLLNINEELASSYLKINVSMKWYEMNLGSVVGVTTIKEEGEIESFYENNKIIITNSKSVASQAFVQEQQINFFESLLIKSATVPYSVTLNSIIYEVPALNPGESITLSYEIDYLIPTLISILLIVIIYLSLTRSLIVKKELKDIKVTHNSLSFKIILNITNVSNNKFNLKIREFLPSLISDVYDFGTVRGEIKPVGKQKYIQWNVKNLKPKENVEFSYNVKTKVGFLGDLKLDNSRVEILNEEGKIAKIVNTQTLILSVGQKKKKVEETEN